MVGVAFFSCSRAVSTEPTLDLLQDLSVSRSHYFLSSALICTVLAQCVYVHNGIARNVLFNQIADHRSWVLQGATGLSALKFFREKSRAGSRASSWTSRGCFAKGASTVLSHFPPRLLLSWTKLPNPSPSMCDRVAVEAESRV